MSKDPRVFFRAFSSCTALETEHIGCIVLEAAREVGLLVSRFLPNGRELWILLLGNGIREGLICGEFLQRISVRVLGPD